MNWRCRGPQSNLNRALRREANAPELTPENLSEIEQINDLIQLVMRACAKGSTVDGKKNPAYENLLTLVRARDLLMKGKRRPRNPRSKFWRTRKNFWRPTDDQCASARRYPAGSIARRRV